MTENERLTLTIEQAAKLAGISKSSAYTLARAGHFPGALRLGKRFLISKYQFDAWLRGTGGQGECNESQMP